MPPKNKSSPLRALAIAAHPDDIEFMMAGTLLMLGRAGVEIHYLNLSSGNCGSAQSSASRTRVIRKREAQNAAKILGAVYHDPICDDLEILYTVPLLRQVAAVVREVQPNIVLTHSPQDYMEDHVNTSRLAVTAAFARGMPNFQTRPKRKHFPHDVTVYHGMPHGLRGPLNERIVPELFVDTTSAHATKRQSLAAHVSQKSWLDESQGMDSYLRVMDDTSRAVGEMSGRFEHAEGWRRHNPLGFCAPEANPLRELLASDCFLNKEYRQP